MKRVFIALGTMTLLLTGCASGAELSENDSKRVAQYAADLLLKYDVNYQERLLTAGEVSEEKEKLRLIKEREEAVQELLDKEKNSSDNEKNTTPHTTEGGKETQGEDTQVVRNEEDINDVLAIPGLTFKMDGYQVCDEYSDMDQESGEASVSVTAKNGGKLLVLQCMVKNETEQDCQCNIFEKNIESSVTVNGSAKKKAMMTLLLNDFGTFQKNLKPGESVTTVMVFELSETDGDINDLQLDLNIGGTEHPIKL